MYKKKYLLGLLINCFFFLVYPSIPSTTINYYFVPWKPDWCLNFFQLWSCRFLIGSYSTSFIHTHTHTYHRYINSSILFPVYVFVVNYSCFFIHIWLFKTHAAYEFNSREYERAPIGMGQKLIELWFGCILLLVLFYIYFQE